MPTKLSETDKKDCIQQHKPYCDNWQLNEETFKGAFMEYVNLSPKDFKPIFDEFGKSSEYSAFLAKFDKEAKMWIEVEKMSAVPRNNVADIENVERKVLEYMSAFPKGDYISVAELLKKQLDDEKKEMVDWKSFLNTIGVSEVDLKKWNEQNK